MSKKSRFRKVRRCSHVRFISTPGFTKNKKSTGSQRIGELFERTVQRMLESMYPNKTLANPWFDYVDAAYGNRMCSPDILVIDILAGVITIVECKLTHTKDAYKQLAFVYAPVVKKAFPGFEVRGIEICKFMDAGTIYPVRPRIVTDFDTPFEGLGNVMVWRT